MKTGIEKYQTGRMKIGDHEFLVPCVACTPDDDELVLIKSIESYFVECQNGITFTEKLALEAAFVKQALGLIYEEESLPVIRINRGDFDRVLGQVSQGTLGEGNGTSPA